MSSVVIDCNVLITADGRNDSPKKGCEARCIERLLEIQEYRNTVLWDDAGRIQGEYLGNIPFPHPPGVASRFLLWAWRGNSRRVVITPRHNDDRREDYEEFPDDPDLAGFDPSDRKYVAVAIASKENPPILNATDTDWANDRVALERYVRIESLCL